MGMKCVQCNTDNNLRDRTRNSGRCKQCNHPFVFEPTTITDKKFAFTDPFFQKAIADISSQNMLFFTPKQFLYFIDKRLKPRTSASGCLWIFGYLFFEFVVVIFGSMFTIIFLGFLFKASNLGLAFLLVLTIYNLCYIWSCFRKSKSPEQSIRGRINNAKNLQFLGVMILLTGIPLSLISNSFTGYMTVGLLGLSSYWLGISQKRRQYEIGEIFLVNAATLAKSERHIRKTAPFSSPRSFTRQHRSRS